MILSMNNNNEVVTRGVLEEVLAKAIGDLAVMINKNFESVESRLGKLEFRIGKLESRLGVLEKGLLALEARFDSFENM